MIVENFGLELILNLYGCDPQVIRSEAELKRFAEEICKAIDMKPYGSPLVAHFGHGKKETSGYSLVQLIETSSIVGHFSEYFNSAYLNIFSCKPFDSQKAVAFCSEFFRAKRAEYFLLHRK